MFANSIALHMYFELCFTPKRRTKRNFVLSISGPLQVSSSEFKRILLVTQRGETGSLNGLN